MTANCSSETKEAKRKWCIIFHMLKENLSLQILNMTKVYFRTVVEITFLGSRRLKKCVTRKHSFKE